MQLFNKNDLMPPPSLDMIGRFHDPKLQEEYIMSCLHQKSKYSYVFLTVLIVGWAIIETIARCWYTMDAPILANEIIGFIGLFLSLLSIICCILLFIYASSSIDEKERRFQSFVQVCFIILINLIFFIKIYAIIDAKLCIPVGLHIVKRLDGILSSAGTAETTMAVVEEEIATLVCPPFTSYSSVSLVQAVLLMSMTPQILVAILYEPRLYLVLSCHLFTGSLMVYAIFSDLLSIFAVLFTLIIVAVLIHELHYQRVQSFLNQRKLREILQENARDADAMHAMELRHMIGNVAHDLKTPLASFATGVDLIKDVVQTLQLKVAPECMTNETIAECISSLNGCLSNIRNTNAFMLMAINRCIDYTKASKGMMLVPKYETVDLREALQFPIECMSNIQERIGIKLEPLSEEICSHIITDKQWLQENLLCLLSNAVKYSAEGTVTITVSLKNEILHSNVIAACYCADGRTVFREPNSSVFLQLEVEDNGIGVPEEVKQVLFNSFKQAQRLAGGTGLGLFSLAKRVEALKGYYDVHERGDKTQGSVFLFMIPYRPDPAFTVGNEENHLHVRACPTRILKGATTFQFENTPFEILIVDDSPSILKMSSMLLKRQGHQIWTAENGEIALKRIEEKWKESGRGFDLVLMDLQMPVMDGLEATRRLRKMESEGRDWMSLSNQNFPYSHHVILGVSANSDHDTMKEALESGVNEFLGKPFSLEAFLQSVKLCIPDLIVSNE